MPRLAGFVSGMLWANALAAAALAVAGCVRYTSVGIDSDRRDGPVVRRAYYRVQWPGNGTFRVTWGENHEAPRDGERPVRFDLAGRFLQPPRREATGNSFWNWIGFHCAIRAWRSGERGAPRAASGALPHLGRISVPGVVPVALALMPLAYLRRAAGKRARNRPAA